MASLDCWLIGVYAVIRLNTVTQMHVATPAFAICSVPLKGQIRDKFNRFFFLCRCTTWSFSTGVQQGLLSLLVRKSSYYSGALQIS